MGCQGGGRENTYHVSTVALEGNQEISWPETASFDPMHKLNPKVSNAVHGNRGYPTPRGQRPEEGAGNDGLGRDPPGDTTSRLRRWIDNTRKLRERMTHFSSTPTPREGRERQAKREWHPTIPLGYSAKNHQK